MTDQVNSLKMIVDHDDHYGDGLTLSIDGVPLHKAFEECMDDDIHDSVVIPWDDPHNLSGMVLLWDHSFYWKGNARFLWYLTDSPENEVVPILSCPDDADEMDCLLLCAYVRKEKNFVYWDRIGRIIHEYREWEVMQSYGYTCGEILSKEKAEQYGYNTSIYDVEDEDAVNWRSDHWDDELYRRNMNYLLPKYRSQEAVKWLKDVNWKFPITQYQAMLDFFRGDYLNPNNDRITETNFIRILLEEFPEKNYDCIEHFNMYEEILYHALCDDLINTPLEKLLKENTDPQLITKYSNFIERMWKQGDESIVNVVDVTILEGLSQNDETWQRFGDYISSEFINYINFDLWCLNMMMGKRIGQDWMKRKEK